MLSTGEVDLWAKELRMAPKTEDVFNNLNKMPANINVIRGEGGFSDEIIEANRGHAVLFPTL